MCPAIDKRGTFFFLSFLEAQKNFVDDTTHAQGDLQSHETRMKLSNQSEVPVYTISGSNTARPLPEWLARRRKRSLKNDPEYANRVELLQDFEFEEASQCVRVSEDGEWVMSTGLLKLRRRGFDSWTLRLTGEWVIFKYRNVQAPDSYTLPSAIISLLG